jgi:hypothetical protein
MATISPDPISLTTHQLRLCFKETNAVLSNGTGFIYKKGDLYYLVTNWHNVSGRDPVTSECLSETLAIPDMLSTLFRLQTQPGACHREPLDLYLDTAMEHPAWLEHPTHGKAVDVVALPLPPVLWEKYKPFPINEIQFDSQFKTEVADEAFVIGYPFSDTPYLQLPIWKRASVASEPDVNLDQLPKLLIDTATRPGLSGSPVVMQRIGIHGMQGGVMQGSELIGRIRNFIGVYSGRIGKDEAKAQLGIVWKVAVIDEIIDGKTYGAKPGKA